MNMHAVSRERRSNINKARRRDPIVSVFLYDNPGRCYSISVPSSKSWVEFTHKICKQFQLPSESRLQLYHFHLDRSDIEDSSDIDINLLHHYDTQQTDMSRIEHQCVICAQLINNNTNNNNNNTNATSSDSNDDIEEDDQEDQQYKIDDPGTNIISANERAFGLDLDLFDRICNAKKASKKKKSLGQQYHFHPVTTIQSLSYHLKTTLSQLKQCTLHIRHIDDHYTLMINDNNTFHIRTRRMIWPRNLQHRKDTFDYKWNDIVNTWKWAIFIIHGGKFAGAVYHGADMVLHKTLRRYVIRKKQGKRQMNHMSSSGQKGGTSAGGYKRAWNEKKLLQEIRDILSEWMDALSTCDKIFIHCPGAYNKTTIYGTNDEQSYLYPTTNDGTLNCELSQQRLGDLKHKNKNSSLYRLYRKDDRIMQIPISTHKVTLSEVERVHYWLATCWLKKI